MNKENKELRTLIEKILMMPTVKIHPTEFNKKRDAFIENYYEIIGESENGSNKMWYMPGWKW